MKTVIITDGNSVCEEIAKKVQEKVGFQIYLFNLNDYNSISEILKNIKYLNYDRIIEIRKDLDASFTKDFMICCSGRNEKYSELMVSIIKNLSNNISKTDNIFYYLEDKPIHLFKKKTEKNDSRIKSFYASIYEQEKNNNEKEAIILGIGENNLNKINVIEDISDSISNAIVGLENKYSTNKTENIFLLNKNNNKIKLNKAKELNKSKQIDLF